MNPKPWTPEFELDYVATVSQQELLDRHAEHARIFGVLQVIDEMDIDPRELVVVDVGCGAAGGMLNAVPIASRKIGVDPLMMQYLDNGWIPGTGFTWPYCCCIWQRGFAHEIPLADRTAHVVFCVECLDHCEDMDQFHQSLSELCRILQPGGILFFMLPARGPEPSDGHPCNPSSFQVESMLDALGMYRIRNKFEKAGVWLIYEKP